MNKVLGKRAVSKTVVFGSSTDRGPAVWSVLERT